MFERELASIAIAITGPPQDLPDHLGREAPPRQKPRLSRAVGWCGGRRAELALLNFPGTRFFAVPQFGGDRWREFDAVL